MLHRAFAGAEPSRSHAITAIVLGATWLLVSASEAGAQSRPVGLLFANYCQRSGDALSCTPVLFSVPSQTDAVARVKRFPEVRQPIDAGIVSERVLLMHGAAIDSASGRVFWQAACSTRFFITDILRGETRQFVLDFAALGISGAERGLCLNEWFFDDSTGTAVALGGVPITSGHGTVQFVFALTADGDIRLLHDLRAALDRERAFAHPNQTILSFDPFRREILTGGTFIVGGNAADQERLRIRLDDGRITRLDGGFGLQAQFFDRRRLQHIFWSCFLPGLSDESSFEITLTPEVLAQHNLNSTTDLCYQGFLGGVYDPDAERFMVLARPGAIARTTERFEIGVIDLVNNQWSQWLATNATYDTFRVTTESGANMGVVPGNTFFLSVVYMPCRGRDSMCR